MPTACINPRVEATIVPVPPLDAAADPALGTAPPELKTAVPGPQGTGWIDVLAAHECPAITARRARRAEATGVDQDPIVWERARGANVWDPDGNRYVDLLGGFAVACAGHANPFVLSAVRDQLDKLVHGLGDAFPGLPRIQLARELARITPAGLEQVLFASGGAEAVDAAIKTAVIATGRSRVIAFEGGYHGLTLGVLPASHYRPGFRAPFAGVTGDFVRFAPWAEPLELLDGEHPAAILVEPIQGRGGERTPPAGWLRSLRTLCDERGILLIFDEIYTGFGRAGALFQSGDPAADGVVPDLLCLGKGMTSGFPLSACIGTREVMGAWGASTGEALHTSTFLGHPVGCAAGLAVVELFEQHGLLERGQALGRLMRGSLEALATRHPGRLGAVRGRGCMLGLEVRPAADTMTICRRLLQRGYLLLPAGLHGEVLSFSPPLTLTAGQWSGAVEALEASL
jgi:4-aminobutyrate aminotransferase / (S)-3-amino-2-methylpropionate transaminase / 5-aminovalerate transaminase